MIDVSGTDLNGRQFLNWLEAQSEVGRLPA
jgi:hypothetical protein